MLRFTIDAAGAYTVVWPRTRRAAIQLADAFTAFEDSLPDAERIPAPLRALIDRHRTPASSAMSGAGIAESGRATAAESFRQAVVEAGPPLEDAFKSLCYQYRANLAQLEQWGLHTRQGKRGVVVNRPRGEKGWLAFLSAYVAKESSLSDPSMRIVSPALEVMADLDQRVSTYRAQRDASTTERRSNVRTKAEASGPLLDAVQVACGYLVACRFDQKVSPDLASWGVKVVAEAGSSAPEDVSASATAPATPAGTTG